MGSPPKIAQKAGRQRLEVLGEGFGEDHLSRRSSPILLTASVQDMVALGFYQVKEVADINGNGLSAFKA
jgi:hypothetical protein